MKRKATFKERARKRRAQNQSKYQTSRRRRCKNAIPRSLSLYGSYIPPHPASIVGNPYFYNFNGMPQQPRFNYMPVYNPTHNIQYPYFGSSNYSTSKFSQSTGSEYKNQPHYNCESFESGRGSIKMVKYESEPSSSCVYNTEEFNKDKKVVINNQNESTPKDEKLKNMCLAIAKSVSMKVKSSQEKIKIEDVNWLKVGEEVGLNAEKCKSFWANELNNHICKKLPNGFILYCGTT